MANVARFTLSSARDLNVYGAGRFIAGVLDVDANDLDLLERTRYLVQPYGAVELGIMDEATPKPVLPAVPGPPEPDPYPQYPTMDEIVTAPELRAAFVARRVRVVPLLGQSNMIGKGRPYGELTDPVHPRIFQYGVDGTEIVPMTNLLDGHGDDAEGISPGLIFARHLAAAYPQDVVLLVPAMQGATWLSSDSVNGWRWGVTGNLSASAVAQYQAALAAAAVEWPSAEIVTDAVLWHQGEADTSNGIDPEVYRADLKALIAGFRTVTGEDTPFILGEMVPEFVALNDPGIDNVHRSIPRQVAATGFAEGIAGATYDDMHYTATGVRALGGNYWSEFQRISGGLAYAYAYTFAAGEVVVADDFDGETATSFSGRPVATDNYGGVTYDPVSVDVPIGGGTLTFSAINKYVVLNGLSDFPDGEFAVTISSLGIYPLVIARYVNSTNHIYATRTATDVQLQTRISGTRATVASAPVGAFTDPETLALRVEGDSFSVLLDGVEVIAPQTVTTHAGTNVYALGSHNSGTGATVLDSMVLAGV